MSIITPLYNNSINKRHCSTCGKSGGVLICDGCQLTFCARHVVKHRQELTYQLENVMQDHDLLREDIEQSANEYFYLRKIDKWEKESIKKIQIAAETARADLKQILDKSKKRMIRISRDIDFNLNLACKTDQFSENDLTQWMKQLNDLRLEIKSSYSVRLTENQQSPIYLLAVTNRNNLRKIRNNHRHVNNSISQECFSKATHSVTIENEGLTVKHTGPEFEYAHILGKKLYSEGRHTIRIQIIQSTLPYRIFFGCISSTTIQKGINYNSPFVVGWFGYHEIYQHGTWNNNSIIHGYDSSEIQTNDVLSLTFDCDQRQIQLFHERLNKTHKLPVNTDKAHLPWQLLVVLVHEDDCVKILTER